MNTQKPFLFSLLLCPMLLSDAFAGTITIDKKGKGPNGYDYVSENHIASGSYLTCHDPGDNTCAWVFHQPLIITSTNNYDIDIIMADVEGQIASGEASGSYVLDGEISVTWNAAAADEYVLTVDELE